MNICYISGELEIQYLYNVLRYQYNNYTSLLQQ